MAVFIREEDRECGLKRLHELLARQRWRMLELQIHDCLIPERVAMQDSDVRRGYDHALKHGDYFVEFPDHFSAGRNKQVSTTAPRLNEAFMDRVIQKAGGARYQPPGPEYARPRNADYLIDDILIELKDIEENALTKESRQKRLAGVMRRAGCAQASVPLDLTLITNRKDRRDFLNIIGEPINKALSDAADQIRKTREVIGDSALLGGVILINSGTHFYSHELFVELALKFAAKPGRGIDELFCFTSAMHTNGFDHRLDFATYPTTPTNSLEERVLSAFLLESESLMTDWMKSGMMHEEVSLPPHQAFGFDDGGQTFYWLPETLPSSLGL